MLELIQTNIDALQTALTDWSKNLQRYERVSSLDGSAAAAELGRQIAAVYKHRFKVSKTASPKTPPGG